MKRPNTGENRSFVMAVDASLRAKKALTQLLPLLRPKDSLKIIHAEEVEKPTDTAINTSPLDTKAYYEKEIEEFCPVNTEYISLIGEGIFILSMPRTEVEWEAQFGTGGTRLMPTPAGRTIFSCCLHH